MNNSKPLVSICMITYNQSDYIKQALESVLDQECDFEFEVILSNDSSIDDSDLLIRNIMELHPKGGKVKYFNHSKNLGMVKNLAFAYENCQGKYIAMCEGDDYWIDKYKLEKQINFLEKNPSFSICYHPVNVLFPNGKTDIDFDVKGIIEKNESTIFDLAVLGNYIHTPSVVFRKIIVDFPSNFFLSPIGDFFIWMLIAQHGHIKRLSENMAVYRYGVGVHSLSSRFEKEQKFLYTLVLLSDSIENKSIRQILKNRIAAIKFSRLPVRLRNIDNYNDFYKPDVISEYVPLTNLLGAIIKKFLRKIN